MERRKALKGLAALAAGLTLLPGCRDKLQIEVRANKKLELNDAQSTWIEAISEAILPKDDVVFTTYESFSKYISKMVTFRNSEEAQVAFINGYNSCTRDISIIYETRTSKIKPQQIISYFERILGDQEPLLNTSPEEMKVQKDILFFCHQVRKMSIEHLTTSREYQEQVLEYKLVPGSYISCTKA